MFKSKRKSQSAYVGYKYYYWPHFRDNGYKDSPPNDGYKKGDWYIEQKYNDLKDELLNNTLENVSLDAYQRRVLNAEKLINGPIAKKIKSDDVELAGYSGIKPGTSISLKHVLAISCWDFFGDLNVVLPSTFHPKTKDESIEETKKRNREFFHLSKLMIETVEIFGTSMSNMSCSSFYQAMDGFPRSLTIFLCEPVYLMTDESIACQDEFVLSL
eukprot:527278_1